jgi:hypothetical protein
MSAKKDEKPSKTLKGNYMEIISKPGNTDITVLRMNINLAE